MKKSFLVLVLAALACGARAAEVTAEQACAAVEAWRAGNGAAFGDLGAVLSAQALRDTDGALLWYVVSLAGGGTVVTAGDDRIEPILAVLPGEDFGGVIPEDHPLYAFMRADVRNRLAYVNKVASGGAKLQSVAPGGVRLSANAQAAKARWAKLVGTGAALQAVGVRSSGTPALVFGFVPGFSNGALTHWNQSGAFIDTSYKAIYNYYTPCHYVCGCVATAGATILQYFNVTNGPVAVTNACTFNATETNLVTIGGHYDWSILPKGLGGQAEDPSEVLTDAQRELLGRVAYDVGVCVGMGYDANGTGSGAQESALAQVFTQYFGFATARCVNFKGDEKTDKPFYDRFIYNQLRCGAPVGFGIYSDTGGHSVVAVGYGEDFLGEPYTRVFMGWGGSGDAWYSLPKVGDYPKLGQAITELSLDGNCTPVCGRAVAPVKSAASSDQTADGNVGAAFVPVEIDYSYLVETTDGLVATNLVVTNYTAANGSFGVRIPAGAWGTVTCGDQEQEFGSAPEEEGGEEEEGEEEEVEEAEEKSGNQELYDALPPTMTFTFDAADVVPTYVSPSAALDAANRRTTTYPNGRMLLLVSGRQGDAETEKLKALLAERVDVINANFAVYYVDYDTDPYGLQNGVPALGVFNPAVFDPKGGWAAFNGCLGGFNIATEINGENVQVAASASGEAPSAEEIDALFARVQALWLRINEPLTLKIDGISTAEGVLMSATQAGGYDPALGLYTGLTNGEEVVASVPEVFTNEVDGVVSRCRGWVLVAGTNVSAKAVWKGADVVIGLGGGDGPAPAYETIDSGDGTNAVVQMGSFTNTEVTLVWLWDDAAYRVRGEAMKEGGTPGDGWGEVDVDEAWIAPGEEITITAKGTPQRWGSGERLSALKGWDVAKEANAWDDIAGCTLTFPVLKPRDVTAYFMLSSISTTAETVGVTVDALPADLKLEADFPQPKFGDTALVYGANAGVYHVGEAAAVTLTATTFTDATGGVWQRVGWTNGVGSVALAGEAAHVAFTPTEDSEVTFLWEPVTPEDPEEPLVLELKWSDRLDNLKSGDEVPAGQNVLVAKSALPKNFDIKDYKASDVKNTLTGWKVTGLKMDTTGNLVAVLATNDAVLVPQGVGAASPLAIAANADGTVTVSSKVANAAKGFWYSLYGAESLGGPWTVVTSGYKSGEPSVQAVEDATESAALELEIVVQPVETKRFYKLVVTEKAPSAE